MKNNGFQAENIDSKTLEILNDLHKKSKKDILTMTTLAKSGHPGGAMSSIQLFLAIYYFASIEKKNLASQERDKVVVSHGHTSAGVYSALGRLGFFDIDEAISTFRLAGSKFEGHIERELESIDWSTGNLGQGLSAGCGFALASKLHAVDNNIFVVMGDGEQQKGQIGEARRFAVKHGLNNITVLIDYNKLQLTGSLEDIMPQDIGKNFESDGWHVETIDGHDFQEIYRGIKRSIELKDKPVCLICKTVMGKGFKAIEDDFNYHGAPVSEKMLEDAISEIGLENDLERYKELRARFTPSGTPHPADPPFAKVNLGNAVVYSPETLTDNRSAYGKVLAELGEANEKAEKAIAAVLDCDLSSSVKTAGFEKASPKSFFQGGIQEHNTATIAGALSVSGIITFFSGFGVFGVDETYNQERLNDINHSHVKLVTTHVGTDVGEDGKTHQCIDYLGLMKNLFNFKIVVPADPNQTDRLVRWMIGESGNIFMAMGRSKQKIITNNDGKPFFGSDYKFEYGKADIIRNGSDAAIITMGVMTGRALEAYEILKKEGISVMLINMGSPTVPDVDAVRKAAATGAIVTYEDHSCRSGLGASVLEVIAENQMCSKVHRMGINKYSASGSAKELFAFNGLDTEDLVKQIKSML